MSTTSKSKTMIEGPLAKQILLVSLPLALSNLLQILFNMSDVAVVRRFAGSTALGSVGSTATFVTLFTGFLIGLSNGVNVLVARFYGAGHPKDVSKTVHSALLVSLAAGVLLLFVGLFGSPALLELLNTKEDLLPGAILYLRVYFCTARRWRSTTSVTQCSALSVSTKKPLAYLSFAGVLNILLNLFFVIVCKLDVAGVALASTIAQCVSAGLILHALTKVSDCYALDFRKVRLDLNMTKRILMLGVPAGLQNAIFAIANLFIQAGVNSFDSLMVKGNSAAANADAMVYDAMAAFYMACASFMSQTLRRGQAGPRQEKLLHRAGLLVWPRRGAGRRIARLWAAVPGAVHDRERCHRRGHEAHYGHGLGLLHLGVHGLHDCRLPRPRQDGRADGHRNSGSCVFRVAWVYTIFAHFHTIPALYLLYPAPGR